MAYFTCNVCRIDRPVSTRNWLKSQVTSITLNDSFVVGFYNACRYCSPDCWVDPPIPDGAPPPNTCIICREVRAATRQYWTPSQMKSIWALGTSVTTNHNCCRTCDPSCWVSTLGNDAPPLRTIAQIFLFLLRLCRFLPYATRAQPPPTVFTIGVNLHRLPHHRTLLRHRHAAILSPTGAHSRILRARLSINALDGWIRTQSRPTYRTFGETSPRGCGTPLSAI